MNYDIIGDIHGHADALEALLGHLGYRQTSGAWRHADRQALFVGDFIDRGPKQRETVDIVRRMVDAGSAQAVMGNHEFNAIAWFTKDPDASGEYLRRHYSAKYGDSNQRQHQKFLKAVEGTPLHEELVTWFQTLPLFLELPELRIVHACWHPAALAYLRPHLTSDNRMNFKTMVLANREPTNEADKDTPELTVFKSVEAVLKGIEVPLPSPYKFIDKDGHVRDRVRVRWWDNEATDYWRAAMLPDDERAGFPQTPVPPHTLIGHDDGKPVFVGHYWLTGRPALLSNKVACVDYSVAKGGQLVAYRWDGETKLDNSKLNWVQP
jgi:hypothetical protein